MVSFLNPADRPQVVFEILGGLLLISIGIYLRAHNLDSPPLWIDEAESTVNALTILEHAVPVDRYLGLPLYENTLVRPWPESEEYEFKDDSYSDKGVAVYHAWLPLYSIAASLALFGIEPDRASEDLKVLHPPESFAVRTLAPRIPAIVFSAVFLILLFFFATDLYGKDAAWAALVGGSLSARYVWLGRQARYYSITLAFTALCGWAIWRASRSTGRRRDFVLVGVSLVLLFHCQTLSALILGGAFAAMIPFMVRQPKIISNLILAGGIGLAGTLPWVLLTGFLDHAVEIPKAWTLLSLPGDLFLFPLRYKSLLVPCLFGLLLLAGSLFWKGGLPARWRDPFRAHAKAFYFMLVWLILAFFAYTFLIPAASYFDRGIALVVSIPGFLLTALALTAFWRVGVPRFSFPLSAVSMAVLLLLSGRIAFSDAEREAVAMSDWKELDRAIRSWNLSPGTRIYCSPNNHFLPTYYLGLPVQSVAPVRRSFLENFEKDLVILERTKRYSMLSPEKIATMTEQLGEPLAAPNELSDLRWKVWNLAARRAVARQGVEVHPTPQQPSPLEQALIDSQTEITTVKLNEEWGAIPVFRGRKLEDWTDWWPIFWYRFVDPESRMGKKLNYAGILPEAKAWVLPCTWVIYEWDRDGRPLMDSFDSLYAQYRSGDSPG